MIEQQRVVKCPACGSSNVAPVPLSLIEGRYYKCGACIATFREVARAHDAVDTFGLDQDAGKKS